MKIENTDADQIERLNSRIVELLAEVASLRDSNKTFADHAIHGPAQRPLPEPVMWVCLVEAARAGEKHIRAWTSDPERAQRFREIDGLDMQPLYALPSPPVEAPAQRPLPVLLQARSEDGEWVDVYPAQIEALSHQPDIYLRAIETATSAKAEADMAIEACARAAETKFAGTLMSNIGKLIADDIRALATLTPADRSGDA